MSRQHEPQDGAFHNADQIVEALGFDMAEAWQPRADGFVGGMSKGQMVRALTEAGKPDLAAAVAKLKKTEAVRETAEGLAGTGWVPGFLKPALAGAVEPACAGPEDGSHAAHGEAA